MKQIFTLFLSFITSLVFAFDCPNCTYELPTDLGVDTIYIDQVPDAVAGEYYETVISFRLPKTTTPVAATNSTIPPGITIDAITVTSFLNLPAGLAWTADSDIYYPTDNTDGCATICGIPLVSGDYAMEVTLTADISIISQSTSFPMAMTVTPPVSNTEGFGIINQSGCGELLVDFDNNILSNGQDGFTYSWDFGNGQTSQSEFPPSQIYTEPGVYPIHYEAIIDTVGHLLTNIIVQEVACDDVAIPFVTDGSPDVYIKVLNEAEEVIYQSDFEVDKALPLQFNIDILMTEENYTVEIWDEDNGLGGADDLCGTINFSQTNNGTLSNGDVEANFTILNPITTVTSTDSVVVYAIPDAPVISANGDAVFCEGASVILSSSYTENVQWYKDDLLIPEATNPEFEVFEMGNYFVEYTDENACFASSDIFIIETIGLPSPPLYVNEDNVLTLFDPSTLPVDFSLQWYLNNILIQDATEMEYCSELSGLYTLEVINNQTGCSNTFTTDVIHNGNIDCTLTSNQNIVAANLKIYPNPVANFLNIELDLPIEKVMIYNTQGRLVKSLNALNINQINMNVEEWSSGMYILEIYTEEGIMKEKFVKM